MCSISIRVRIDNLEEKEIRMRRGIAGLGFVQCLRVGIGGQGLVGDEGDMGADCRREGSDSDYEGKWKGLCMKMGGLCMSSGFIEPWEGLLGFSYHFNFKKLTDAFGIIV